MSSSSAFSILLATLLSPILSQDTKDWRLSANYYQIYPRSFMDSNGDGVGDLRGIASKAAYLKEIGMDGIWLSPIFASPMYDFGYDISNYTQIHYEFGNLDDFDYLQRQFTRQGLRLILDFVPNHTSDEHEWFIKSARKESGYEDFYVWHPGVTNPNGGQPLPPNNWIGSFRFSAWKWHEGRGEYFLHQFGDRQPDLNYRNPAVVEAMKETLRFWLRKGIGGFRFDAVPFLFEDEELKDEPLSGTCNPDDWCYLDHIYTQNLPETYDLVFQFRQVLKEFDNEGLKVMMTEAYASLDNIIRYYGNSTVEGSHVPFNFELLLGLNRDSTAKDIKNFVDRFMVRVPQGRQPNWVLGNHDNHRYSSRLGEGRADVFTIMIQTLPGNAVTYYGEEIEMTDVFVPWDQTVDPQGCNTNETVFDQYSRDPARTPMQWDNTKNAGFSKADKTWLPVAQNYSSVNVRAERLPLNSHFKMFKRLTRLRKTAAFRLGDYQGVLLNDDVFAYLRWYRNQKYLVVLNFGNNEQKLNLSNNFGLSRGRLRVILRSVKSNVRVGQVVKPSNVVLGGQVGVIFKVNQPINNFAEELTESEEEFDNFIKDE